MPRDASRSRPGPRPRADARSWRQHLQEGDGIALALGWQWLVEAAIAGRQIQFLGLGLTVAGGQIDTSIAACGDLVLQLGQQGSSVSAPPLPAVGPDALELRSLRVEPPERPAGDRLLVVQADEHGAAGRGELAGRVGAQP